MDLKTCELQWGLYLSFAPCTKQVPLQAILIKHHDIEKKKKKSQFPAFQTKFHFINKKILKTQGHFGFAAKAQNRLESAA